MSKGFGNLLRQLRMNRGYSQQQLADLIFVDRSSISSWETGRRIPDASLIARLCECLGVDADTLLGVMTASDENISIMVVDDEKLVLNSTMRVIRQALPGSAVTGFSKPSEAIAFVRCNHVNIAFIDIEVGQKSGLDLCKELLAADPQINVVFLTAYIGYSYDAWNTGACGFLLKPLTAEDVYRQLTRLRHPLGSPLPNGE